MEVEVNEYRLKVGTELICMEDSSNNGNMKLQVATIIDMYEQFGAELYVLGYPSGIEGTLNIDQLMGEESLSDGRTVKFLMYEDFDDSDKFYHSLEQGKDISNEMRTVDDYWRLGINMSDDDFKDK